VDSPATLTDWVFPWPEFDVDWASAALLVIDVQNYCCNPRAGIPEMLADKHPAIAEYYATRVQSTVIPNISLLLAAFRGAGREVVYTRHGGLLPDGRDLIARRRTRDAEALTTTGRPTMWPVGSFEHQIVDELAPMPGELVLDKNASSPFNGTGIDQLLRNLGVETVVLVGTATDMCVETTGRDAADRGYNVIVAEDATATFYEAHHEASLSALARVYGRVARTSEILGELDAAPVQRVPASAEINALRA
jgi:nicotinamidase-related amidase